MKYPLFLLLAATLFAQQEAPKSTPSSANNAPIISMDPRNKSTIVIDSKARAGDYVQAFDFLRKDKPTLRIALQTTETLFSGVADLVAASGGTLLMAKVPSNQGYKTVIIPVEQILEISYSP
jgi:hypothetical protein